MAEPKKSTARAPRRGKASSDRPEELESSTTGTTTISGVTFAGKAVTYAKVGDLAIFEGDIVLGRHADLVSASPGDRDIAYGVAITGSRYRWPGAVVPYEIDPAMPDQFRVNDAIAHWVANTTIRFVLRTPANAGTYLNYVHFFAGGGCYSTVGMVGGRQDISLGGGCSTGNAIHEIGHTLGLWHEQSREDRNSFVTINYANIDPAMVHNFDQHISDGDDLNTYDYGSIMHYPATAFSTNGQPTIVPTQPGVSIGQRTGLSAGDLAAIRIMYPSIVKPVLDPPVFKKFRDDSVNFKKITDDRRPPFKKIRDDVIVGKPVGDVPPPFGHGGVVVNPQAPGATGGTGAGGGDLPFILATPHHAAAAAAYAGYAGYAGDGGAGGYGGSGDPATDLLASAAASAAAASASMAEVAAALGALAGLDGSA